MPIPTTIKSALNLSVASANSSAKISAAAIAPSTPTNGFVTAPTAMAANAPTSIIPLEADVEDVAHLSEGTAGGGQEDRRRLGQDDGERRDGEDLSNDRVHRETPLMSALSRWTGSGFDNRFFLRLRLMMNVAVIVMMMSPWSTFTIGKGTPADCRPVVPPIMVA